MLCQSHVSPAQMAGSKAMFLKFFANQSFIRGARRVDCHYSRLLAAQERENFFNFAGCQRNQLAVFINGRVGKWVASAGRVNSNESCFREEHRILATWIIVN